MVMFKGGTVSRRGRIMKPQVKTQRGKHEDNKITESGATDSPGCCGSVDGGLEDTLCPPRGCRGTAAGREGRSKFCTCL